MYPYDNQPEYQTRTAAAYKADGMTDGVIVPVLKSLFLGFTTGVLVGLLAWAFNATFSPWLAFAVAWFVVMPFSFWRYSERAMWMIERIVGADLNGDSFVGQPTQQPQAQPESVRIELVQDQGRRADYIDLPYPEKLPALAQTVLEGRQYTQAALVAGGILKREEYETIKGAMLSAGLMRYKNPDAPNAGIVVTSAGKAVLRRFLPQNALPSPTNEDE